MHTRNNKTAPRSTLQVNWQVAIRWSRQMNEAVNQTCPACSSCRGQPGGGDASSMVTFTNSHSTSHTSHPLGSSTTCRSRLTPTPTRTTPPTHTPPTPVRSHMSHTSISSRNPAAQWTHRHLSLKCQSFFPSTSSTTTTDTTPPHLLVMLLMSVRMSEDLKRKNRFPSFFLSNQLRRSRR